MIYLAIFITLFLGGLTYLPEFNKYILSEPTKKQNKPRLKRSKNTTKKTNRPRKRRLNGQYSKEFYSYNDLRADKIES